MISAALNIAMLIILRVFAHSFRNGRANVLQILILAAIIAVFSFLIKTPKIN